MMSRSHDGGRRIALAAGAVVLSLAVSLAAAQQATQVAAPEKAAPEKVAPEKFSAFAVNMGSAGAGGSGIVQITIDRWSTDSERQALVQAFQEKGSDGLLTALQKSDRIGTLRTPNSLGWDLHYAHQEPTADGGRHIFLATDRTIGFWEASRQTRTTDYPFTLVELHLDKDGQKGEGRMSLATKIARSKDGTHIELENYSSEPVRLQNVRKQK